ncbi:hypothetical protein AVEN_221781-1 [Araneus ventricosus]|uniref:Uncharacterized protein n=1 Tax=Araneus ventricosus TaxID=182803 RepID=A0A4Y2W8R1_ARAVE|nr:hypothetical protein AVEN_221781-1 [Araneus ventricosus]
MSIDEDIPLAATITDMENCQAVYEQDKAIKVDDSHGDECVEENPPTNAEMRQALDILKLGVQHRSKIKTIREQWRSYGVGVKRVMDSHGGTLKPAIHFADKLDILESEKEKAIKIYGNQPNGLWWLEFRLD